MKQVGVLSALFLTIITAFLLIFNETEYDESWKTGTSVIIWTLAFVLMLMATVNTVLLLLASNECKDDAECEKLLLRLGKLVFFPAQIFHLSVLMSCLGILYWAYNLLTWEYFVALVGLSAVLYTTQTFVYWFIIRSVLSVRYEVQQEQLQG